MPSRPSQFSPQPAASGAAREREHDARRRRSQPWRGWYDLAIWQRLRSGQLAHEPLCERCLADGIATVATVVHHRIAHRGDWALFVDPANHASLCKPHHDREVQGEERETHRGGGG